MAPVQVGAGPVFIPIRPRSKRPVEGAVKWSEPDADWRSWWDADLPDDVNKALRLDGLIVIDCDTEEARLAWRQRGFDTPVQVKTPHGHHYYYRLPEGVELKGGPILPRTDLKTGPKHYVLVPPSVNEEGVEYLHRGPTDPYRAPVASPEMIELLGGLKSPAAPASDGLPVEHHSLITEGSRNDTLTKFAGLMRRLAFDDEGVRRVLQGLNRSLTDEPLPIDEVEQIVQSSARWDAETEIEMEPGGDDPLISFADEMELPPPPHWYWKPYIPEGRLVLVDGAEGIGKGMFATKLALSMASGRWPDGASEPGAVLWMSAEDDPEEDILRRLYAAGYDPDDHKRIGFFNVTPSFPKHIEHVERLIETHGAKLVIMDPGRSYLGPPEGTTDFSYNQEAHLRPGLEALNKLAKRTGTTILFIHHWNKNTQVSVQYRQGGSGAFAQVVRHRITMAWVGTTEDGVGAFEVTKSNIERKGGLRGYDLVPHEALSTAYITIGDRLANSDLNGWIKEAEAKFAGGSVELDATDELLTWAEVNLQPGSVFPPKPALAAAASISERNLTKALGALAESGRAERLGSHWVWNG